MIGSENYRERSKTPRDIGIETSKNFRDNHSSFTDFYFDV